MGYRKEIVIVETPIDKEIGVIVKTPIDKEIVVDGHTVGKETLIKSLLNWLQWKERETVKKFGRF